MCIKKPISNGITKRYSAFLLVIKKRNRKIFENIYVKFKGDCVELSDWKDFRMLIYVPYAELERMDWIEEK